MSIPITLQDVVYAALIALFLTWLIKTVSRVFRMVTSQVTEYAYKPKNMEIILQRCAMLFPNENIRFKGSTFTRGMHVRVVTVHKRTIEGKLIGGNDDNLVCVVTESTVVTQEVSNIADIHLLSIPRT